MITEGTWQEILEPGALQRMFSAKFDNNGLSVEALELIEQAEANLARPKKSWLARWWADLRGVEVRSVV